MNFVASLAFGMLMTAAMSVRATASYAVIEVAMNSHKLLAAHSSGWDKAQVIAWGPAPYKTRFRAVWNQAGLNLRFDADDVHPWHTLVNRDDRL